MRNMAAPNVHKQVARTTFIGKDTRQKPLAFRWWKPDCDENDGDEQAAGCTGLEPPLINGWEQVAPPLEPFAFRLHADGSLEFKGHLDAGGASSGSIAFVLPGAVVGEVDFRPPNNQFFHTTITDDSGASFTLALVRIVATTGAVTITWPAVG